MDIGAVELQAFDVFSQMVYDDALQNGWVDYSYNCTRDFANLSPVHSGIASMSVQITSAYGGAQFHHDSFTNAAFGNISFWINGGASGGQHLQMYGVSGGTNQTPRFLLNPLPANTWVKYVVPLSALGEANTTNFDAFVIQDRDGTAQPVFYLDDIQLLYVFYPPQLGGATRLGNGTFQFSFTSVAGASFTIFASTNVAQPFNAWSNLGSAVETPANSGQFQFADPQATNKPVRFYRVRSP